MGLEVIHRVIVAATAVAVGALIAPTPALASAYPPLGKKTLSHSYSTGYCFTSKQLKRSFVVRLSGRVQYQRNAYKFNKGIRVRFHDPTLINPKIDVKVATKCDKGAKKATVSRTRLDQRWYDWKCNRKVGITIGVDHEGKWGVSVNTTKRCGSTTAADRATRYGRGSHYEQFNSGAPVKWHWGSDGKGIDKGGKICLNADAGITAYVGNTSDTANEPLSVCVPASYA
ncbi:hypothetical protein NE236_35030 [Actinoallomurus purpureus]|uniref:hypothetical protein n=1 Tax=Actinoallomurus purpureus TaxID=478114 RepID=UPI002092DB1C|nr:hypothetical protein [Actinoallomurus purpureus]MCO6010192.1 hypothetical protein [Actinoallomurus purpureus]